MKIIAQLDLWILISEREEMEFVNIFRSIQFGIYTLREEGFMGKVFYFMPELLIIFSIMIHQFKETLIGLLDKNEDEIESIHKAARRLLKAKV